MRDTPATDPSRATSPVLSPELFFGPGGETLGLQIYTLGDEAQTDMAATFDAVAAIGYTQVELVIWGAGGIAEMKAALDRSGLAARSAQANFMGPASLANDIDQLIANAQLLGLDHIAASIPELPTAKYGGPHEGEDMVAFIARIFALMTADDWKAYAQRLNQVGAALQPHGLTLLHHNHNFEFRPLAGSTGYDILLECTDPALVGFELDVGWVRAAGLDPLALLARHPGRFRMMHIKDLMPTTEINYDLRMDPAVAGDGMIDWAALLPAARAAGITGYFVEQEPPFTMPRIEAARRNFDYLSTIKG